MPFPLILDATVHATAVRRYPNTISALAFSRDGSLLAVASSYTYERGDTEHGVDEIYVRKMQGAEIRPRQRKQ